MGLTVYKGVYGGMIGRLAYTFLVRVIGIVNETCTIKTKPALRQAEAQAFILFAKCERRYWTFVSPRRFFAQASGLLPSAAGRSLP